MIPRHEHAKAVTRALTLFFSYSVTLYVAPFIYGVFLAVLRFQMRVSHWALWFPHVRGRLRAPDSLTWRWDTWQVL